MSIMNVNPTAMELQKLKKRYKIALRGHKLLKDKLDELMRQFLLLVQDTKTLRIKVEKECIEITKAVKDARRASKKQVFDAALSSPFEPLFIGVEKVNIMSVEIPRFSYEKYKSVCNYGYAYTSMKLDKAAGKLNELFDLLIKLAENEKAIDLLSKEISATRRRVNSLEHILIPNLTDTIHYIFSKLDEADRSNRIRLIKVKEMVINNKNSP